MSADSPRSHAATIDPQEADLLITSVMAAVRATNQDRRWGPVLVHNVLGVLGVAAVLAVVSGGLLVMNQPRSGVGSAPSSPATFYQAGLAFEYPSDWTLVSSGVSSGRGRTIVAFVGSAEGRATCVPVPNSGGALECDTFVASLQPNTLVARIEVDESTPWEQNDIVEGTAQSLVIGGLPALTGPSTLPASHIDADRATTWILSSLQDLNRRYIITVAMRGPDLAALEAQLDSLLASVSFDPPSSQP
jgi:hypothetical protein